MPIQVLKKNDAAMNSNRRIHCILLTTVMMMVQAERVSLRNSPVPTP